MPTQQIFLGLGSADTFSVATGGTITTDGDFKVHEFTSSGTFTVTSLGNPNSFECFVVSGGCGPGSNTHSSGGGGGAIINHQTAQALTQAAYTITVGAGGTAPSFDAFGVAGNSGNDSSIKLASDSSIIVEADVSDISGGGNAPGVGSNGGNSAKVVDGTTLQFDGGTGNVGNSGASAGGAGSNADGNDNSGTNGGNGGSGLPTTITGSSQTFGGGGGGGSHNPNGFPS